MIASCHPTFFYKSISPAPQTASWDLKSGISYPAFVSSGYTPNYGVFPFNLTRSQAAYCYFRAKIVTVATPLANHTCTIPNDFNVNGGGPLGITSNPYPPTGGSFSIQLVPTWVNDDWAIGATQFQFDIGGFNLLSNGSNLYHPFLQFSDTDGSTYNVSTFANGGDPSVGTLYFLDPSSTITADIRGTGTYGDVVVTVDSTW